MVQLEVDASCEVGRHQVTISVMHVLYLEHLVLHGRLDLQASRTSRVFYTGDIPARESVALPTSSWRNLDGIL
jgi:hypothetical protein